MVGKIKACFYSAFTWLAVSVVVFSMLETLLPGISLGVAEATVPALNTMTASGERFGVAAMQAGYNIVFILTDQERYFDAYPQGTNYEARERLKDIATTFEKHYICANMSTSSRSVIYTGKHIPDTKMFENTNFPYQISLNPDIETIGDKMRSLGYYTAYKGKFHLMDGSNGDLQKQNALEPYGFSDWNPQGDLQGRPGEGYTEDAELAAAAGGWLRSTGTKLNTQGTPFFLAVNLVNPHDIMYFNTDAPGENVQDNGKLLAPIQRAPDTAIYQKTYNDPVPPTWSQSYADQVPAHEEYNKSWSRNTGKVPQKEENWKRFKDFYYNTIQDSDNQLGKILDDLEALGMMDKTIIVLTSDHGELQGAHNLNGKGNNLYEYGTHVPLIVYHPDFRAPAGSSRALTSHLDLVPTFVQMTNASAEKKKAATNGLAGKNLLPLTENTAASVRDDALFACSLVSLIDARIPPFTISADAQLASDKRGIVRGLITAEGYKFARYFKPSGFNTPRTLDELFENNDVEIFNLNTDPHELRNLAEDLRTENPDLLAALNARLNRIVADEIGIDDGREFSAIPKIKPLQPANNGNGCVTGSFGVFSLALAGALHVMRRRTANSKDAVKGTR